MFDENDFNFSSVEEVKDFLSDADNRKVIGVICFLGPDGEKVQKKVDDLIEEYGIDVVSDFLYSTRDKCEVVTITKDEINDIIEKAKSSKRLSKEEERKFDIITASLGTPQVDTMVNDSKVLYDTLLLFIDINKNRNNGFDTVGGLTSIILTFYETLILMNTSLRKFITSEEALDNVIEKATEAIHIDENISPDIAIIGLLHRFGELVLDNYNNKLIDTKELRELLGLKVGDETFGDELTKAFDSLEDELGLDLESMKEDIMGKDNNKDDSNDIRKKLKKK